MIEWQHFTEREADAWVGRVLWLRVVPQLNTPTIQYTAQIYNSSLELLDKVDEISCMKLAQDTAVGMACCLLEDMQQVIKGNLSCV